MSLGSALAKVTVTPSFWIGAILKAVNCGCAADTDATTVIEGHLRYISTSPTFNKLVLRTTDDQEVTIRTAKEKKAFDRDGKPVSLVDLHDNELLRISYYVMGDEKFAEHIDIR